MSGTVVAQFITFGLSFLLARIYLPDEFGRYSIFVGCAGVLAAAATGAFDRVILLAGSAEESRRVATLTLVTSASIATLTVVLASTLVLTGAITLIPLPAVDILLFLPAFVIFYACAQVFIYASLREDRLRLLSMLKVAQSSLMGAIQVAASGLSAVSGLILGNLAGWFVLAVAGLRWRSTLGFLRSDLQLHTLKSIARTHSRYPRYIMPNEVLDNLSNQVPILLIGTFLSLSDAGHYGLAIMILSAPAALLGQAVGQSFLQYLGNHGDDARLIKQLMLRIWLGMAAVAFLPFGLVFLMGDQIFEIAFGSNWSAAGGVAQALALLLFVRFVSSPTSTVYLKLGMQKEQWRFCLAAAFYRTAAYSLTALNFSLLHVIWVHVITEVIFIILYNFTALRRLQTAGSAQSVVK